LIRAGTGVCANHRAAGRARSRREFIAKLAVVVEEADEAELWLEALLKCALARRPLWIRFIARRPSCARSSASRYIPRVPTWRESRTSVEQINPAPVPCPYFLSSPVPYFPSSLVPYFLTSLAPLVP
jgi:hypothetical protein